MDFSNLYAGEKITLMNLGPDSPFGGMPIPRRELADPATTGLVMQFNVVAMQSEDSSVDPARLILPKLPKLSRPSNVRKVSLNEEESAKVCVDAGNLYRQPILQTPLRLNAKTATRWPLLRRSSG